MKEGPQGQESDPGMDGERLDETMPSPPSFQEYFERSAGRLLMEAALGGSAGALLAMVLGQEGFRTGASMVAGAMTAPLALMLTPLRGSPTYRGVRYGLALTVLLTLVVSLTGPGRERPVNELILFSFLFFALGALGHGAMAATVDRELDEEEE